MLGYTSSSRSESPAYASSSRGPYPSRGHRTFPVITRRLPLNLFTIPQELLLKIMSAIGARGLLQLRLTCTALARVTMDHTLWCSVLRGMYIQRNILPPSRRFLNTLNRRQVEALAKKPLRFEDCLDVLTIQRAPDRLRVAHCANTSLPVPPGQWVLCPGGKFIVQACHYPGPKPGLVVFILEVDSNAPAYQLAGTRYEYGILGDYYLAPDASGECMNLVVSSSESATHPSWNVTVYRIPLPTWKPLNPVRSAGSGPPPAPSRIRDPRVLPLRKIPCGQFAPLKVGIIPNTSTIFGFIRLPELGDRGMALYLWDWETERTRVMPTAMQCSPNDKMIYSFAGPDLLAINLSDSVLHTFRVFPSPDVVYNGWMPSYSRMFPLPFVLDRANAVGPDVFTATTNPALAVQAFDTSRRCLHQVWYDHRTEEFDVVSLPLDELRQGNPNVTLASCHVGETHSTTLFAGNGRIFSLRLPNPDTIKRNKRSDYSKSSRRFPAGLVVPWRRILSESLLPGPENPPVIPPGTYGQDNLRIAYDEITGRVAIGTYGASAPPRILVADFCG